VCVCVCVCVCVLFTGDSTASSSAVTEGNVWPDESPELGSLHRPCGGWTAGGGVFLQDPRPVIADQ